MLKKLYDWLSSKVQSIYAEYLLFALFYIEGMLPVPVNSILILYCLQNRKKSFRYAAIGTIASVLGSITAYFIGQFFWTNFGEQILNFKVVAYIMSKQTFYALRNNYHEYANWATLVTGFMPVPYNAATLSAGFCQIPLLPFIFFTLLARGARFFLVAIIIRIFGAGIFLVTLYKQKIHVPA